MAQGSDPSGRFVATSFRSRQAGRTASSTRKTTTQAALTGKTVADEPLADLSPMRTLSEAQADLTTEDHQSTPQPSADISPGRTGSNRGYGIAHASPDAEGHHSASGASVIYAAPTEQQNGDYTEVPEPVHITLAVRADTYTCHDKCDHCGVSLARLVKRDGWNVPNASIAGKPVEQLIALRHLASHLEPSVFATRLQAHLNREQRLADAGLPSLAAFGRKKSAVFNFSHWKDQCEEAEGDGSEEQQEGLTAPETALSNKSLAPSVPQSKEAPRTIPQAKEAASGDDAVPAQFSQIGCKRPRSSDSASEADDEADVAPAPVEQYAPPAKRHRSGTGGNVSPSTTTGWSCVVS